MYVQFYISSVHNTIQRKLITLHSDLFYNNALLLEKKIAKFQRNIIAEFFHVFQLPPHYHHPATVKSHEHFGAYFLFPQKIHIYASHIFFIPYSISGLLSPPVFSLKFGHSTGDLPWGRQKRPCLFYLSSQESAS